MSALSDPTFPEAADVETASGTAPTPAAAEESIVFDNVSKFYGEVLGVNRISLSLEKGIIGLVGPNGSGKSTVMNLITGLLRPTQGQIRVLGISPDRPQELFRQVGYLTQYDAFPSGVSGFQLIYSYLRVHGYRHREAGEMAWQALERVKLADAGKRRVAGYSKGMRQRVRLAQAISHRPRVLILDEPLNGLDPMARAEVIDIFQDLAAQDHHLVISSHILHEVDMIADRVVLLNSGYVVADGAIQGVRSEMEEHPIQVLVRCDKPHLVAARLFEAGLAVEAILAEDHGLLLRTRDAKRFYLQLNDIVMEEEVKIETVSVADSDVRAVYQYLISSEGELV